MGAFLGFISVILAVTGIVWLILAFVSKRKKLFPIILMAVSPVLFVVALELPSGDDGPSGGSYGTAVILALAVLMVICIVYMVKQAKEKRAKDQAERTEKINAGLIPAGQGQARHVAGLPITTGVPCALEIFSDRVSMSGAGQHFEVPMGRVTGAELYEDTEMRQHIKSSLGGTILGGLAFGEVGAIIGGMPESKYRKEIAKYNLLVNYTTEDQEPKALLFTSDSPLKTLGRSIQHYRKGAAAGSTTVL